MDGSKYERYLGSFEACNEVSALGNLRSHWTRRALVLLVALLLVITFQPGRAFAAGNYYPGQEVIVDGMVAGDGDVGYMCIAYTNFNAALVALGVSVSDARLTDDARAKLSNASTGGDFFLFADSFHTRAQLYGNVPSWADDPMLQAYVSQWENIAGSGPIGPYQDIFYATVSPDLVNSAKMDLLTVLNGGDLGGGAGAPQEGDYVYIPLTTLKSNGLLAMDGVTYKFPGNLDIRYQLFPYEFSLKFPKTAYSQYRTSDYKFLFLIEGSRWSQICYYVMIFNKSGYSLSINDGYGAGVTGTVVDRRLQGSQLSNISSTNYLVDGRITLTVGTTGFGPSSGFFDNYTVAYYECDGDKVNDIPKDPTPVVPPSNWPSEPEVTAPTAPEVPEPSEPEIPSQPVQPSAPSLPDFPSNVISPGTTYETFDIQAILDAMDEHCIHLQQAIYTGFSDYFDVYTPWLSQELETVRACIRGESQWQMDVLHTELDDLQDYLWQLFQWLAARMQFDVGGGGYDDSSVVSWLKRIYFKLGGGSVSTRPIDPVVDPGGISDWLDKLFQQLIDALFGVGANVLAQLLVKLQALEEKFPFCIPWDIGAILALMVATPEAPAFDLPCYSLTSEGVQQVGVYEIDLSVFDDYMGPIRSMQTILFAAYLCFKVDWFKSALKMEGLS